jgi:hypothetical protein
MSNMEYIFSGYHVQGIDQWDPEIAPDGTVALDANGKYPGEDYVVAAADKYPYNAPNTGYADYIRVTPIGEVAPRMRDVPRITVVED